MPSIQLIQPWVDPANSIRGVSVDQMYDVHFTISSFMFSHDIGANITIPNFRLYVRNKTLNAELVVNVSLPIYLQTVSQLGFTVGKNATVAIDIVPNSEFIVEKSKVDVSKIFSEIGITVDPINYFGPVYIRTDLKALAESLN